MRAFGTPVMDALGPIPYPVMNTILDASFQRIQVDMPFSHDGLPTLVGAIAVAAAVYLVRRRMADARWRSERG